MSQTSMQRIVMLRKTLAQVLVKAGVTPELVKGEANILNAADAFLERGNSNELILHDVINFMRARDVDMTSPYDLENWMEDNASHTQQFECGAFKCEDDDDDEESDEWVPENEDEVLHNPLPLPSDPPITLSEEDEDE